MARTKLTEAEKLQRALRTIQMAVASGVMAPEIAKTAVTTAVDSGTAASVAIARLSWFSEALTRATSAISLRDKRQLFRNVSDDGVISMAGDQRDSSNDGAVDKRSTSDDFAAAGVSHVRVGSETFEAKSGNGAMIMVAVLARMASDSGLAKETRMKATRALANYNGRNNSDTVNVYAGCSQNAWREMVEKPVHAKYFDVKLNNKWESATKPHVTEAIRKIAASAS